MIATVGMFAGLRRVVLLALAEIPLVIILMVIIPGIAVQPFLPDGFARLQALIKMANVYVNSVLTATADHGGAPKGCSAMTTSGTGSRLSVPGPRRGRGTRA